MTSYIINSLTGHISAYHDSRASTKALVQVPAAAHKTGHMHALSLILGVGDSKILVTCGTTNLTKMASPKFIEK